jgi:hypothetical protein
VREHNLLPRGAHERGHPADWDLHGKFQPVQTDSWNALPPSWAAGSLDFSPWIQWGM